MRRILVGLVAAVPLALGAGAVLAQADPGPGPGGQPGATGQQGPTAPQGTSGQQGPTMPIPVVGTVVSTGAGGNADSFVANAYVPAWPGMTAVPSPWNHGGSGQQCSGQGFNSSYGSLFGSLFSQGSNTHLGSIVDGSSGSAFGDDVRSHDSSTGPTATQVTIAAGDGTKIFVNGTTGTVAGMTAGDEFVAFFSGTPGESLSDLVENAPLAIIDHTPPTPKELYAFVGTVSSVTTTDASDGTVTVDVDGALPSTIASSGDSVPLTVTADTLILGGSSSTGLGTTLSDINDNDIVVGGLVAPEGDTLTQLEALPLKVLLDIPVAATSGETSAERSAAEKKALKKALAMIGEKLKSKKSKKSAKKSHKKSGKHSARKHSKHSKRHAKKS